MGFKARCEGCLVKLPQRHRNPCPILIPILFYAEMVANLEKKNLTKSELDKF